MLTAKDVTLRAVDEANRDAVLALGVTDEQRSLIATVERSLNQVASDPSLRAFAVYDAAERGAPQPKQPPVGFVVVEVAAGVGFILRLMIDARQQGQGYGRAALQTAVRYLQRVPEVEMVATSYRAENRTMAQLVRSLGFVAWKVPWSRGDDAEVYVKLGA